MCVPFCKQMRRILTSTYLKPLRPVHRMIDGKRITMTFMNVGVKRICVEVPGCDNTRGFLLPSILVGS